VFEVNLHKFYWFAYYLFYITCVETFFILNVSMATEAVANLVTNVPSVVEEGDDPEIEKELLEVNNKFTSLLKVKSSVERPLSPIATRRWKIVSIWVKVPSDL